MRLTIIHDSNGNIRKLVAYPADGPAAYPATRPGELVAQVEIPELTADRGAQKILEHLSDLAENYRVEVDSKTKLTRKVNKAKRGKKIR